MLQFDTESTICAVATGEAAALRGAVRITGPDTISILSNVLPDFTPPNRATRTQTFLKTPELGSIPVSVYCWPDSRSYTGQPSAELHMLGAPVLLQQSVEALIRGGAKLAEPGEFTLRAFLAGRLDLTQCEAVLGVIHANNQKSLDVALTQLAGGLAAPLQETRRDLIHILADIEAGLDFVDEDISFITPEAIASRLTQSKLHVQKIIDQMDSRSAQSVVTQVAIVGKPNAGKSSLINALAQCDIAIVSPIPGTTRDFLRFRYQTEGIEFDLLDTAGMEEWADQSPRGLAQSFTQAQIDQADLILFCSPLDEAFDDVDVASLNTANANSHKTLWTVLTKSDLHNNSGMHASSAAVSGSSMTFSVSAIDGEGISELKDALSDWVAKNRESQSDAVPMTVERCKGSMINMVIALDNALESVAGGHGDEVTAGEIRIALDEIGLVNGTIYTEDVLDALFSRFCIGK